MKKHLPLIIGIALPIVFIIIISLVIWLPSLSIQPAHNFIYSAEGPSYGNYGPYRNSYKVVSGRLTLVPHQVQKGVNYEYKADAPTLFLYDVKNNTVHQIEFAEAERYILDPGPSSPDGYIVSYNYNHDGIFELFGSNNSNSGYTISKGNARRPLVGLQSGRYGYGSLSDFQFIGWIKQ